MAARFFRYQVTNKVQGSTLKLVAQRTCSGDYTPDWHPTPTIPFMAQGGMQGESSWPMTGTVGWLKYRLTFDSDGSNRGLLYLPWSNPYYGGSWWNPFMVGNDVEAHCDPDAAGGAQGITDVNGENAWPTGLRLTQTVLKDGDPIFEDALIDPLASNPLTGIAFLAGHINLSSRVEVLLELSSDFRPTTVPFPKGQRTSRLETHPTAAMFVGQWSGEGVQIDIEYLRVLRCFRVHLVEAAAGFSLTTYCALGSTGIDLLLDEPREVLRVMATSGAIGSSTRELGRAAVALAAVSTALVDLHQEAPGFAVRLGLALRKRPPSYPEIEKAAMSFAAMESRELQLVSKAVTSLHSSAAYTLHPTINTSLQLYRELLDGSLVGYTLHYVRLDDSGQVLGSRVLNSVIHLG